ncbi:MAG: hypothetical protein JSS27_17120 [Planctomycetes bacterium]|nr:hypothetical protein [Planctomycetota bacterium]
MARKLFIIVALVVVGLLIAAASGWFALRHEPDFYAKALDREPIEQEKASDAMLAQATGLASQARKPGRWSAVITADEINGWLAVDLPKNHARNIPPGVSDPRVRIVPGEARLACRYADAPGGPAVISVIVDVHVAEPNVLSIRLRGLKAGAIPLPLTSVVEEVTRFTNQWQLPTQWRTQHGDPVALVDLKALLAQQDSHYQLDACEFKQGELWLAGETLPANKPAATNNAPAVPQSGAAPGR